MTSADTWYECPFVGHSELAAFGNDVVNIRRQDLAPYREQLGRVVDKIAAFVAEHPDYHLVKPLRSGSVAKGTALRTLNDMDVAIYMEPQEQLTDEAQLLDWLCSKLREAYGKLMRPDQFTPQDHTVCISFERTGLDVEVAPVIYEGDKDDKGYLVSRDTGKRVLTSIPLHLEFIRTRKDKQPKHFAQVVRLLKWWACERKDEDESFKCKSFMIELICAHLADEGLDFSDYFGAVGRFFAYVVGTGLRTRISFSDYYKASALPARTGAAIEIFDPVNPANNVAEGYGESERARLVAAAQRAFDAVAEARYATTKGASVELWQGVFGTSFGRAQ